MNAACPGGEFQEHDEAVQVINFAHCATQSLLDNCPIASVLLDLSQFRKASPANSKRAPAPEDYFSRQTCSP
jgi:hypothetical protein